MAMTINTAGVAELSEMLSRVGDKAEEIASGSLYKGAGVVADAFSAAVNSIRTEPFKYAYGGRKRLASPEEKAALQGKTGVAKFRKNGSEVDTIIGIGANAGYADIAGNSKAVRLIGRSINSGTSFMVKQPVFRKAVSSSRGAAVAATVARADEMIRELTD